MWYTADRIVEKFSLPNFGEFSELFPSGVPVTRYSRRYEQQVIIVRTLPGWMQLGSTSEIATSRTKKKRRSGIVTSESSSPVDVAQRPPKAVFGHLLYDTHGLCTLDSTRLC